MVLDGFFAVWFVVGNVWIFGGHSSPSDAPKLYSFQVKKKQFFKNFTTILLLGVIGTVVSFCFISFGAFFLLRKIGLSLKMQDYLGISKSESLVGCVLLGTFPYLFITSTVLGISVSIIECT